MRTLRWLFLFILLMVLGTKTWAQVPPSSSTPAGQKKQIFSFSTMALTSSTKQGGNGPSGSTILSKTEYVYAWPHIGLGMFFLYDLQGSTEKDSCYGPKLEGYWSPFYLEFGYIVSATRAYTDRTIANQTGDGMYFGVGARFKLGPPSGGQGGNWFFQASYNYRTLNIKKQDNSTLGQSIQQTDGYPLVGLGYEF